MIYTGEFSDIHGRSRYRVVITTETGDGIQEVTLGASPFCTRMDDGKDTIYAPCKCTGATVEIRVGGYAFDVYSKRAQGTRVELLRGDDVVWTGYATPNLYSMPYVHDRETIQVECIDGLATLSYIKYECEEKRVVSFLEVLNRVLSACGCYTRFYFPDNTQLTGKDATEPVLERLFLSEKLFFKKKEAGNVDTDVAWTDREVLDEICRYMGVSCTAVGDEVYFLDYDAIGAGQNTYYRYDIGALSGQRVEAAFKKAVSGTDYSGTGATLSMTEVYNKITVKDDLYTFEDVFPDMFDKSLLENITAGSDTHPDRAVGTRGDITYKEFVESDISQGANRDNVHMECMLGQEDAFVFSVFMKYFRNPLIRTYLYRYDTTQRKFVEYSTDSLDYGKSQDVVGASLIMCECKNIGAGILSLFSFPKIKEMFEKAYGRTLTSAEVFDLMLSDFGQGSPKSSVSLSNFMMLSQVDYDGHLVRDAVNEDGGGRLKMFSTNYDADNTALFGGENAYLVISGDVIVHEEHKAFYPIPEGDYGKHFIASNDDKSYASEAYLEAELKWGGKYWDGARWSTAQSTFRIPFLLQDDLVRNVYFKAHQIPNTVSWRLGADDAGYMIPLPADGPVMSGMPEFTLYHLHRFSHDYNAEHVFIKDFAIKAGIADPTYSRDMDSDTAYTNIIAADNVVELEDISFKICTWDDKSPNYSCVAYSDGSDMYFLDKTYNRACYQGEQEWSGSDDDAPEASSGLRQEEHLVYRLSNQYATPSVKLCLSLRNDNKPYGLYTDPHLPGRKFIVDTYSVDYKRDVQDIVLIEKK
ncbi:hypothetical protein [Prevotella sp. KH2C16]|uniref:hypothetical protein n=1 Tax=Prevotella sp. KH2C16 TaxID=1855325 RepID=UPI0008E603D2|nr:hypothetical protein [Prevotella sp. KH2C16]SFF96372.1 hypothetical protein SAMN05216383_1032 [Prevotella sp. KH2C16]